MATSRDLDAEIGSRVRRAAKAAGVTHEDLAVQVKMSPRTLTRFIAGGGEWKVSQVRAVGLVVGVSTHDLIGDES
jgi:ribosome-binding protein aMBF1 (putative translation factor)